MANTVRAVPIDLDRPRHIRFDFNALSELEDLFEINLLSEEGWQPKSVKEIRTFVRIGLRHEEPELTDEQVGAMLDMVNITTVIEAIKEAIGADSDNEAETPLAGPTG